MKSTTSWQLHWLCAVLIFAHAAPATATTAQAEAMAKKAKVAYDRAEFAVAAQLYNEAFRADPLRAGLLYSAGRASQKAGLWDDAAKAYAAFLATPGAAGSQLVGARRHLAEVQQERVRVLLERAAQAATPSQAYDLARRATEIDPERSAAWFAAARAAAGAGMPAEARSCYLRVLALAVPGSAEHAAAGRWLTPEPKLPQPAVAAEVGVAVAITPTVAPVVVLPAFKTVPPDAEAEARTDSPPSLALPLSLAVAGTAAIAVAAKYFWQATGEETQLDLETNGHKGADPIPMAYSAAEARATAIADRKTVAALGLGGGAALLATAVVVWRWQAPAPVRISAYWGENAGVRATWTW